MKDESPGRKREVKDPELLKRLTSKWQRRACQSRTLKSKLVLASLINKSANHRSFNLSESLDSFEWSAVTRDVQKLKRLRWSANQTPDDLHRLTNTLDDLRDHLKPTLEKCLKPEIKRTGRRNKSIVKEPTVVKIDVLWCPTEQFLQQTFVRLDILPFGGFFQPPDNILGLLAGQLAIVK